MKTSDLLKEFDTEHRELEDIRLQVIEAQEKFENAQDSARCSTCEIGTADSKKDFYERYQNCKFGLKCGKTCKLFKEFAELRKKEDAFRDKYASKVYAYLSEYKPDLINRQSKETERWVDAFGDDYSGIDPNLKTSLVALVEEVGGRYRISES